MRNQEDLFLGAAPILFQFARELRKNQTAAERFIWGRLAKKQVSGYRFRCQHPILYFVADFYCHSARLIIEIDGGVHRLKDQFEYDQARDFELKSQGITVLRFTNEEVMLDIENVLVRIEETLTKLAHKKSSMSKGCE
jgi:very-short-patch-repair endonuclease